MDTSPMADRAAEPFRSLVLRHRGRTGLTQRELAARMGASRRTLQDWESGVNYPMAERLQALILVLLEAGGLTVGREATEAQELWAAVLREAPRMRTPFDEVWLTALLAERAAQPAPNLGRDVIEAGPAVSAREIGAVERRQDWGDAPDTVDFVGRAEELRALRTWVLDEGCRLVGVVGMGGIGKTSLAAKLAQDVAPSFERVYWRSLRDAPPASDWLAGAIGFLSDQQLLPPTAESERLAALLQLLRDRRCLLVLDNVETLFEPGQGEGCYRRGLAGWGHPLRAIGEVSHQSCLALTSREAPAELAVLGGDAVRTFSLGGLGVDEAQGLLAPKQLVGTTEQWAELIARFGGNGLALKVVGESIRELFGGEIGPFLEEAGASSVFGGIRRLLSEQVERSSASEHHVLRVLAVEREPVHLKGLLTALGARMSRGAVLEAIEALRRRSLVERAETAGAAAFTLQSVVLEYVTDRLVDEACDEIARGQPVLLVEHPLIQAQAKDYVRQTQERLIGAPILQVLSEHHGENQTEQRLLALLESWRNRPEGDQGYGPGNVINLLRLLRGDLRGLDLSRLAIRQAYLAGVETQDASLVNAKLADAALADAFSLPVSVALTPDGALLATGTSTGEVWLWRAADRTLVATLKAHAGPVFGLALTADGRLLASGGADGTVRLWDISTGGQLSTLQNHTGAIWGLAFSADGRLLASGSADGTVRLWNPSTGRQLVTLQGDAGAVWAVALAADGHVVAGGGSDGTIWLWDVNTGRALTTLEGHTGAVRGLALSADGQLLASGGFEGSVRLWDARTGRLLAILSGHSSVVRSVALSSDSQLLASCGEDGTVRLWETSTGRLLKMLQGHTGGVWGVALAGDGLLLASAGMDEGAVRLWEASTGRLLTTLQGHTSGVYSVALAADGRLLASGSADGTVRLWDANDGRLLTTLQSHAGGVYGVALRPDGRLLASAGGDGSVRLWDLPSGRLLVTLYGHTSGVWGVALAADGGLLASGGFDGMVRLWELPSGRSLATMQGHTGGVYSVALCADGHVLASGGFEGTVRLWDTSTAQLLATLQGHTSAVFGVALTADGRLLASGSADGTVRLWDASTARPLSTLPGHTSGVIAVALSADGQLVAGGGFEGPVWLWDTRTGQLLTTLQGHAGMVRGVTVSANRQLVASGSEDGTLLLWEASSGTCLHVLRSDRRYERMDITDLSGVTAAQRAALVALGAVEQHGPAGEPTATMLLAR
jgi:WD40 repeat protein/transcriptional regulator with XRE-family HTH domain